jgi:hypothetical protein
LRVISISNTASYINKGILQGKKSGHQKFANQKDLVHYENMFAKISQDLQL